MPTSPRIVINIRDDHARRESVEARQTVARWLVGLTTVMTLFCGFFPFDFSWSRSGGILESYQPFDFRTSQIWNAIGIESVEKFFFYIPLGFAFGSLLWVWRGVRPQQIAIRCGIAFLCCAGISTVVEVGQIFNSRDPSLADIISKTAGCTLGFVIFNIVGEAVLKFIVRGLLAVRRVNDVRLFGAVAIAWLLIGMVAPLGAGHLGSLKAFDAGYPLLIGNETDGIRHWDGTVSNIWLSDKALHGDEVDDVLVSKTPAKMMGDSLVAVYHLDGHGPYHDATGNCADLAWTPNFKTGATPDTTEPSDLTGVNAIGRAGVPISEGWWLSTPAGGAEKAIDRISRSDAFTVVIDAAMGRLDRGDGWPRIFSISPDAGTRDIELLQDHQNLQVRVRNLASGKDCVSPELIVPNVFEDLLPHRLAVCYDNGLLTAESDAGGRYSLRFASDTWLVWRIFPSNYWHYRLGSMGQEIAAGLYRALVMFPVGMLVGAILRLQAKRGRSEKAHVWFIGGILGGTALLEVVLCMLAGVPVTFLSPIVGVIAGCAGTFSILGYLPWRRRWV
jgi:VanZ family protein